MTYIDILIILAISNLISEQKIIRDIVLKVFQPELYLEWSKIRRFFFDMISCWSCLSFHVAWIYLLLKQEPFSLQLYIGAPLISMLIADIILKLKR